MGISCYCAACLVSKPDDMLQLPMYMETLTTSVDDWHANVTEDVMGVIAPQQLGNALPAVLCSVHLLKVVLASISRNLQLWPCSIAIFCCAFCLDKYAQMAPSVPLATSKHDAS